MKKRSCRMTEEEKSMHERAVRIRKMTDAQICDLIDSTYGKGMEEGAKIAETRQAPPALEENAARKFLHYLEARQGSGNRIGKGTIIYLTRELENAVAAGIFAEEAQ